MNRFIARFALALLCLNLLNCPRAGAEKDALPDPEAGSRFSSSECTNLIAPLRRHPFKKSGSIETNTSAFQEYALKTALEAFARINKALKIGGPDPVGCANVTKFLADPSYWGLHCSITLDNRFNILIDRNRISNFSDYDYWLSAFENRSEELENLLRKPNVLTKKSAETIARGTLKALGLENGKNVHLREPPSVRQWESDTGPMPFFDLEWKDAEFTGPADAIHGMGIFMEISGVSSNVCHFSIVHTPGNRNALLLPYATNFFQLLGMSETNRFWQTKWKTEGD